MCMIECVFVCECVNVCAWECCMPVVIAAYTHGQFCCCIPHGRHIHKWMWPRYKSESCVESATSQQDQLMSIVRLKKQKNHNNNIKKNDKSITTTAASNSSAVQCQCSTAVQWKNNNNNFVTFSTQLSNIHTHTAAAAAITQLFVRLCACVERAIAKWVWVHVVSCSV